MFIESRWSGGRCNLAPSVSAWAMAEPCSALPARPLPRVPHFPGSGKHLPRPSGRKPGSPLLVSKVQPPCRPPTTDVLRPVQEGEENTREQRWCSLRPAGCWEGTGLPPMFLPRSHGHRTGPVKYQINNFILNIHLNVFVFVCVDHTVPCKFYLSCKFEYFAGNSKNE